MAEPKKDTVQIPLPSPASATPIRRVPPKLMPGVGPSSLSASGPKKETARISVSPQPAAAGAPPVNIATTELALHSPVGGERAPVIITSKAVGRRDEISRPLCWVLFAISALIFLIQIWNYVVS